MNGDVDERCQLVRPARRNKHAMPLGLRYPGDRPHRCARRVAGAITGPDDFATAFATAGALAGAPCTPGADGGAGRMHGIGDAV